MGKDFLLIMPFLVLLSFSSCEEEDSVTSKTENTINGHEYVDLGLPSGTLWATCNVGATKPEEYGDYFAWGETKTKEIYDWGTYKYGVGSGCCSLKYFTKYNTDSRFGNNIDNFTTLFPDDDVASVNWGGKWRMPSIDDQIELIKNCQLIWVERNEVKGYKALAKNGNSIFLPAAGFMTSKGLVSSSNIEGYYSSSSLCKDYPYDAHKLYFNSNEVISENSGPRNSGITVRAVLKKN